MVFTTRATSTACYAPIADLRISETDLYAPHVINEKMIELLKNLKSVERIRSVFKEKKEHLLNKLYEKKRRSAALASWNSALRLWPVPEKIEKSAVSSLEKKMTSCQGMKKKTV